MTPQDVANIAKYQKESSDHINQSLGLKTMDELLEEAEQDQKETDEGIEELEAMLERSQRSDIIRWYNEGASPKEIANELMVSIDFVEQVIGEQEAKYN